MTRKVSFFNIGDLVSNRLRTLEAKFSSLIGPVAPNTSTRTELALPSTSARPTPPPRSDSIPMLEHFSTNYTRNCEGHGQTRL